MNQLMLPVSVQVQSRFDLLRMRQARPSRDQMPRMKFHPPTQHGDLIGGEGATLQAAAHRVQDGIARILARRDDRQREAVGHHHRHTR